MELYRFSLPENENNISVVRAFAKEKGFSLQKVRNKDFWNLKDLQSGEFVLKEKSLMDVHDFLCRCGD